MNWGGFMVIVWRFKASAACERTDQHFSSHNGHLKQLSQPFSLVSCDPPSQVMTALQPLTKV